MVVTLHIGRWWLPNFITSEIFTSTRVYINEKYIKFLKFENYVCQVFAVMM